MKTKETVGRGWALSASGLPGRAVGTRVMDRRYAARPPGESPRPYFELVLSRMVDLLEGANSVSVLDIGSANGAFQHFLLDRYPGLRCFGIEALEELVEYAASAVPEATFQVGDICNRGTLPAERFSIVTMLTLHSHFDDIESWLDNLLDLVAPGGRALLFGTFNPVPVDVFVRLRMCSTEDGSWIPGWNIHSRRAFKDRLMARRWNYAFYDYRPHIKEVNKTDPLRTRSAVLDGRLVCVNGAGLILPFALLEAWNGTEP